MLVRPFAPLIEALDHLLGSGKEPDWFHGQVATLPIRGFGRKPKLTLIAVNREDLGGVAKSVNLRLFAS